MGKNQAEAGHRQVVIWLIVGIGMIMVQVLLGGITRLTGSGLSITEWKPILGALPPLNQADWEQAFEQYKKIGQFKHLNFDFSLADFKFIYFWEWFHRLWGRLIGIVFLLPFVVFLRRGWLKQWMTLPLILLFMLGGLQALLGWIMVASGLGEDKLYVDHIKLAIHFMAAIVLFVYAVWFALKLIVPGEQRVDDPSLRRLTWLVLGVLVVQLVYGAFMAGLKAANFAPTWPTMNGQWWPEGMFGTAYGLNWIDNPIAVQFIHRGLAYLLCLGVIAWSIRSRKTPSSGWLRKWSLVPLGLVTAQLLLGILTVVNAPNKNALLWWGVAHQFTAMLLLASLVFHAFLLSPAGKNQASR